MTQFVAVTAIGVASIFSGLAAANALPDSAQRVVSDVLGKVGVQVPSPDDATRAPSEGSDAVQLAHD